MRDRLNLALKVALMGALAIAISACGSNTSRLQVGEHVADALKMEAPIIDGKLTRISWQKSEDCKNCSGGRSHGAKRELKKLLLASNLFTGNENNKMKIIIWPESINTRIMGDAAILDSNPGFSKVRLKYEVVPLGGSPILVSVIETSGESHALHPSDRWHEAKDAAFMKNIGLYAHELRKSFYNGAKPLKECCDFSKNHDGDKIASFLVLSPFLLFREAGSAMDSAMDIAKSYDGSYSSGGDGVTDIISGKTSRFSGNNAIYSSSNTGYSSSRSSSSYKSGSSSSTNPGITLTSSTSSKRMASNTGGTLKKTQKSCGEIMSYDHSYRNKVCDRWKGSGGLPNAEDEAACAAAIEEQYRINIRRAGRADCLSQVPSMSSAKRTGATIER